MREMSDQNTSGVGKVAPSRPQTSEVAAKEQTASPSQTPNQRATPPPPNAAAAPKTTQKRIRRVKGAAAPATAGASEDSSSSSTPSVAPVTLSLAMQAQALQANHAAAAATAAHQSKPTAAQSQSKNAPTPAPTAAPAAASTPRPAAVRLSSSPLPLVLPSDPKRVLVTSSLATSASMVDLFVSWQRDLHAATASDSSSVPQKSFVLEFGAGANQGRNAWMFLGALASRAAEVAALTSRSQARGSSASASASSLVSQLSCLSGGFTYLLTDPLQSNLDNLRLHPQLAPFFAAGLLDVAVFDPTAPNAHVVHSAVKGGQKNAKQEPVVHMELYLQHGSTILSTLDARTPLFCICNEQMHVATPAAAAASSVKTKSHAAAATVPSRWKFDAFRFEPPTSSTNAAASNGTLQEWRVSVQPEEKSVYPSVEWSSAPVSDVSSYYGTAEFNSVLTRYAALLNDTQFPVATVAQQPLYIESLPKKSAAASAVTATAASPAAPSSSATAAASSSTTTPFYTFTLPITAFQLMHSLRSFARGPLMLIVAERGFTELVALPNQRPSVGFAHGNAGGSGGGGSFTPPNVLNLHALEAVAKELGGFALTQQTRGLSNVKVTAFGFEAPRAAALSPTNGEDTLSPLPNRLAAPVKSALKSPTPPLPEGGAEIDGSHATTEDGAKPRKVKFAGLTFKEQRQLKRAEKERALLEEQARATARQQATRRDATPPPNVLAAFRAQFDARSPFDVPGIISLCCAASGATTPAVAAAATPASAKPAASAPSALTLKHALSLLSLSNYDLDVWCRLKSLFVTPMPREDQFVRGAAKAKKQSSSSPLPMYVHARSAMEHDLFTAFSLVWSRFFAMPYDIYGSVPLSANVDLAFEFGSFYCIRRRFRAAIAFYQRSLEWFGQHHVTLYNIAQCHIKLRCYAPARQRLAEALALDSGYTQAQQWLQWVDTQIGGENDASVDDAAETAAIERAFVRPFDEPVGEADEEEVQEEEEPKSDAKEVDSTATVAAATTKPADVKKHAPAKDATVATSAVAVAPTASPSAPAAAAPTAAPVAAAPVSSALVDKAAAQKAAIEKKRLLREKDKERKLAKRAAAAEAAAQAAAANNATADNTAVNKVTASLATVAITTTNGAAASSTPSLQSFLKTTPNQSWADMDDDADEPRGPAAVTVPPTRVQTKRPTTANGAHQQQQPSRGPMQKNFNRVQQKAPVAAPSTASPSPSPQ